MIANILIAFAFSLLGIVVGAYVLDQYHERQRLELEAMATAAQRQRHDTAVELARAQSLVDALSREIATLKAQRSRAESLHAERIRRTMEAARWN